MGDGVVDVLGKAVRRVRTPEGAELYDQPIGSVILPDLPALDRQPWRILKVEDTRAWEEGPDDRWHAIPGSGSPRECDRCGRMHEIHVTVETADKRQYVVGVGCALVGHPEMEARVKAHGSAAMTLARLEKALEKRRQEQEAWDKAKREVDQLAIPEHTVTRIDERREEWRIDDDAWVWVFRADIDRRMAGEWSERRRAEEDLAERLRSLHDSWRNARMKERGQPPHRPSSYDLEQRLARHRKKIAKMQKEERDRHLEAADTDEKTAGVLDLLAKAVRRVRTPEGARHYNQPIGSVIRSDVLPDVPRPDLPGWDPGRDEDRAVISALEDAIDSVDEPPASASPPDEEPPDPNAPREVTFDADRLEKFKAEVERLNKIAAKLKVPPIRYEEIGRDRYTTTVRPGVSPIMADLYMDMVPEYEVERVTVAIQGQSPRLPGGWTYLGTIEYLRGGPGEEDGRLVHGDDPRLAQFRSADPDCDYCHLPRDRKKVMVLVNDEGQIARVGSSCLKDFLGYHGNPERVTWYADEVDRFVNDVEDEDSRLYGRARDEVPTDVFLDLTAAVVREFGWVPKSSQYGVPTVERVRDILHPPSRMPDEYREELERVKITDADRDKARRVREWAAQQPYEDSYLGNLRTILGGNYVEGRRYGYAASAIGAWERAMGIEAERRARREAEQRARQQSDWVGKVGEKREFTATVTANITYESAYGPGRIVKLVDEDGNVIKTFTSGAWSREVQAGDKVKFVGTVKGHDQYRGTKETNLTRVGKVQRLDQEDVEIPAPTPDEALKPSQQAELLARHGGESFSVEATDDPHVFLLLVRTADGKVIQAGQLKVAGHVVFSPKGAGQVWKGEGKSADVVDLLDWAIASGWDRPDPDDGWAEGKAARRVRTPEGARHFGQPIGSLIVQDQGASPLDYSASTWQTPRRLALVDPAAGDPPRGDFGFAELRSPNYYGPSGRRLKKPRTEITPGAAPGTVAFVDYTVDRGVLKVNYVKTRKDRGGEGLASELLAQLIESQSQPGGYVDFGKLMNERSARLLEKMKERFPDRHFKAKIWYKQLDPLDDKAVRRVRTPEGSRRYNQPIGSVIRPDMGVVGALEQIVRRTPGGDLTARQREGLRVLADHPVNRQLGDAFTGAGHQLYLVGGSVRDAMAGSPDFSDLDYTTDATPEEIHAVVDSLGPTWSIGEEFGTVGVQIQGLKTEITTFRRESYDPASRNPVVAFGDNIEEDLARRDLTINAMALALAPGGGHSRGELVDPHGGARDLANGLLRTPDDPMTSMSEDPLRQLRVVRFAAKRRARVDPDLASAVREQRDRLSIIATERKTDELRKVLKGGPATTVRAIDVAEDLGVTDDLFGGLDAVGSRDALRRLPPDSSPVDQLAVLAAVSLRRGGDDPTRTMAAMKLANEEIRPATAAARLAVDMTDPSAPADVISTRRLVRSSDPVSLSRALRVADALEPRDGEPIPLKAAVARLVADEEEASRVRGPLPVDGYDLLAIGLRGRDIGAALERITDAFLADPDLSRDDALRIARDDAPEAGDVVSVLERSAEAAVDDAKRKVLGAPVSPAFRRRLAAARSALPESSADWFPGDKLDAWDPQWRRSDGSPGPRSLAAEARVRGVGKVIDDEIARRVKTAGVRVPLDKAGQDRIRKKRDAIYQQWSDRKWDLMDEYSTRIYGKPWKAIAADNPELFGFANKRITEEIHRDHPDLAEMHRQWDELLQQLIASETDYHAAYAEALDAVLRDVRSMGGDIKAMVDPGFSHAPAFAVAAGPNSGVIPYQYRHQGPAWDPRVPRPVNIDRAAVKDYNRLTPADAKKTRQAIRDLEQGRAQLDPKRRGSLVGTYSVRIDEDARLMVYPHIDGTWHIFAILPHHDYREAERRMAVPTVPARPRRTRPAVPVDVAAGPTLPPIARISNREFLSPDERSRVERMEVAAAVVDKAAGRYPTDWVDASNSSPIGRGGFIITQADPEDGRGYYRHRPNWDVDPLDLDVLALSNDVGSERVALHELGHRMQKLVPAIRRAEWTFHWRRTSRTETVESTPDTPEAEAAADAVRQLRDERRDVRYDLASARQMMISTNPDVAERNRRRAEELEAHLVGVEANLRQATRRLRSLQTTTAFLADREPLVKLKELLPESGYKEHERTRPDRFVDPYVGKDYGDGPDSTYEVFTMGIEGVWTGSQDMYRDPEHKHLILGLLAAA